MQAQRVGVRQAHRWLDWPLRDSRGKCSSTAVREVPSYNRVPSTSRSRANDVGGPCGQTDAGGPRGAWALNTCRRTAGATMRGSTTSCAIVGRSTSAVMAIGVAPPAVAANTHGGSRCFLAGCPPSSGAGPDSRSAGCCACPGHIAIVRVAPRLATGMKPGGTMTRINSPGSTSSASRMRTDRSLCRQPFTGPV